MTIIDCDPQRHPGQILAIFNEAIVNSTALYDYKPRTEEMMRDWFAAKVKGNFPVIGMEDEGGQLLGFASYGTFRAFPGYKYTVEHSVYVHHEYRGRGIGEELLKAIISRAREQDYHVLVGCIDASNRGSIRLHEKLGFTHSGTITQAGFKFGRWLDAAFYQLTLATPTAPKDG